jgi:hypothetical protein
MVFELDLTGFSTCNTQPATNNFQIKSSIKEHPMPKASATPE